ncbi:MAG: hypothetical protein WD016_04500 [Balneolaceae bacterium]
MWLIPELSPNETRQQSKLDRFFDHQTKAQALVRESIQNSLDAGISEEKAVEIKFSFDKLSKDILKKYFDGENHDLEKHLNSCGISIPSKSIRCLTIEDFRTEGLTGPIDNMEYDDEDNPVSGNFIGFWWSEGLSDKRKGSGGSHGVGKITLSTSSNINTFFAYTVRKDDPRKLLIGYSQLKYHSFDRHQFKGYARYGKIDKNEQIWPYDERKDSKIIEKAQNDFNLKRANESGLSVIIPSIDDEIDFKAIIQSVLKEFYVPLMRGQLKVEVSDLTQYLKIEEDNIISVAEKYLEDKRDKELIKSAQEMLKLLDSKMFYPKHDSDLGKVRGREILPEDFTEQDLKTMQRNYSLGKMVGTTIPVKVRIQNRKSGKEELKSSRFHIFIQNNEDLKLKRSTNYIRDKLLINSEGAGTIKPFSVAFLYVNETELSDFLKYAEDPGHERWVYKTLYENGNIDTENDTPLRLIKSSISDFYNVLAGVGEDQIVDNVLPEIFNVPEKKAGGQKGGTSPDPNPDPKTRSISPFVISKLNGGFKIKQSNDIGPLLDEDLIAIPFRVTIETGYYKITGGGVTKYNSMDFDLSDKDQFEVIHENTKSISRIENKLVVEITANNFSITVTGFDENRDLEIKCQLNEPEVA